MAIKYAADRRREGATARDMSAAIGASARHVRRLYAAHRRTCRYPAHGRPGRPFRAAAKVPAAAREYEPTGAGARRAARIPKRTLDTRLPPGYRITREKGMVGPSRARARRRKRVRYERLCANAMWHVGRHTMRGPRWRGMQLVAHVDDASRCVTAAAMFSDATSENAVLALRQAIKRFGAPATILSDNGKCFVGARSGRGRGPPKGGRAPAVFEAELVDAGIGPTNSRPCHPQANCKLERSSVAWRR